MVFLVVAFRSHPLISLTAALLFAAAQATCSDVQGREANPIVLPTRGICAHRGANRTQPENTLAAFREAIRLGAHQIEFDVRLTKDDELVIMHDDSVDRTTDGKGNVAELTLQQIKQLDAGSWKDPRFAGECVPTLAETLTTMPTNIWLNVHLKGDAKLGAAVARVINRQARTHQAFIAAEFAAADGARRACPQILVCNMERQQDTSQYVEQTLSRKCEFLQLLRRLCSPTDMQRLERASVRVNYCCTNDPEQLPKLYEAGVDFPLVDDVATMMAAAEKLGIRPLKPVYQRSP